VRSATLRAPAQLQQASADVKAVGKIEQLTWAEGDTIELLELELESDDV